MILKLLGVVVGLFVTTTLVRGLEVVSPNAPVGNARSSSTSNYQSCMQECGEYWDQNPDARPTDTAQICTGTIENLKNTLNSGACADGASEALTDLPSVMAAYAVAVPNAGAYLRKNAKAHRKFIDACEKDVACKVSLLRSLSRNRERDSNGAWKVSDAELTVQANKTDILDLLASTETQTADDRRYCGKIFAQILNDYADTRSSVSAYQVDLDQYQLLAAKDPICLGVMQMTKPVPRDPQAQLGSAWLKGLGIKLNCYDPDKMAKLWCYDFFHTVLDPLNYVPVGLAYRAIKLAGRTIKRAAVASSGARALLSGKKAIDGDQAINAIETQEDHLLPSLSRSDVARVQENYGDLLGPEFNNGEVVLSILRLEAKGQPQDKIRAAIQNVMKNPICGSR